MAALPRLDRRSAALHPGLLQELGQQQDQLGVQRGVVRAQRLGADLVELAVAPGLGRLVAEERAPVAQLHRLGQLVHAVLHVGAARARGALRPQRQRAPALVLEREHLLLHDVRGLAHAAREHLGVLEHGRVERRVAGQAQQLVAALAQRGAALAVLGQHVEGPARGLQLPGHRGYLASSARKGFVARSAASVVWPMWPGCTRGLRGQRVHQRADRLQQRRPVAAGQVDAAHRALEEHVAGEHGLLVGDRERHVAGAVTGREHHVDVEPGQLQLLAAGQGVLGLPVLERAEARPRARRR